MRRVVICLDLPEEHLAPSASAPPPAVILVGDVSAEAHVGRSSQVLTPECFRAATVYWRTDAGDWHTRDADSLTMEFSFFSRAEREARDRSYAALAQLINRPVEWTDALFPVVAIFAEPNETVVAHHMAIARRGNLYVTYAFDRPLESNPSPHAIVAVLERAWPAWDVAAPSYSESCWNTQPPNERERKFTFRGAVDTWQLAQRVSDAVKAGALPGFILEFNEEWQVWDFDNYMYEVLSPPEELGYVSFIPQANGLTTVKWKRFPHDCEERDERVTNDLQIPIESEAMRAYAEQVCGGTVRPLPAFRRKLLHVPLESLDTGNDFGLNFDICRVLESPDRVLVQCEVELNRSRIMRLPEKTLEEHELVCDFVRNLLIAHGYHFEEGFYSKLSFLRDCVSAGTPSAEMVHVA